MKLDSLLAKKTRARKTLHMVDVCSYLPQLELIDIDRESQNSIRHFSHDGNMLTAETLDSLHMMNTFYENDVRLFKRAIHPGCLDSSVYADQQYPDELLLSLEESVNLYSDVMHLGVASIPRQEYTKLPEILRDIVEKSKVYSGYHLFLLDNCSCIPYPEDTATDDPSKNRYFTSLPEGMGHSAQIIYHLTPLLDQGIQFFDRPIVDGCVFDTESFNEAYDSPYAPALLSAEDSYRDMLKTVSHHLMILETESVDNGLSLDSIENVRSVLDRFYKQ